MASQLFLRQAELIDERLQSLRFLLGLSTILLALWITQSVAKRALAYLASGLRGAVRMDQLNIMQSPIACRL